MKVRWLSFFLSTSLAVLCGCTTPEPPGTGSLAALQQLRGSIPQAPSHHHTNNLSKIRYTAIQDAALSVGAQSGLAWRALQIDTELKRQAAQLDETYNFYAMLLNQNVLPPVLAEAQNTLNLADPDTIRLAAKIYKIISQARFVTAPPTWRDYIWMNYPKPDPPDRSLLPRTAAERRVWSHYVAIGWQNGITQANNIFSANLNRLIRDYNGMALYRKLYAQNMVSAPFVAKTDLGITGDASHMDIGDRILRITALPALNLNGNTWKPGIIPQSGSFPVTAPVAAPPQTGASGVSPSDFTIIKRKHPRAKIHITNDNSGSDNPWIK